MEKRKLGELTEIVSGQIMTRVKVDTPNDETIEVRKVIIPKAITSTGMIVPELLAEERLKAVADDKRITKPGDIVIKLNSPYDSATIDVHSEGCVVPSFCAILRIKKEYGIDQLNPEYLQAFLNSTACKEQLDRVVQGAVMTILSVGKLKEVEVLLPDANKQTLIGNAYRETQKKLVLLDKIEKYEKMKNDAYFNELEEG